MNLNNGLQIFREHKTYIYVAPKEQSIAVSVHLNDHHSGKFSEPFLIKDQDYSSVIYYSNGEEKVNLKIGKYLQTYELEIIKKKSRDLLADTALTGSELAKEIDNLVLSVGFEFDKPSQPHELIPDNPVDGDPEFLLYATNDDLARFAFLASSMCIPYMHPWDAYLHLQLLRKNALKNAKKISTSDLA